MIYNFAKSIILQLPKQEPFLDEDGRPTTVRDIAITALLHYHSPNDPADQKVRQYKVARKLMVGEAVELNSGEVELIKSAVAAISKPTVLGQVYDFFENKDNLIAEVKHG